MNILKLTYNELTINGKNFYSVEIFLPKTTLLIVGNEFGYFMCGALDVNVFNLPHLKKRGVVCGRSMGVKTIDELLNSELELVTDSAKELGINSGMKVSDALLLLS